MKAWPLILGAFLLTIAVRRRYRAPLEEVYITSPFGPRVLDGVLQDHNGVDLRAAVGTPVLAIADGVVTWGWNERSGNYILLQLDGSEDIRAGYAHLSRIDVAQGARVTAGQIIGLSGNTGSARGPHLHFTIRVNGDTVDPSTYVQL